MPSFLNSKITSAVLVGIGAWLLLLASGAWLKHGAMQHDLSSVNDQIAKGERENAQLSQDLERMQQPAWLALLARERLNYKRADETVVFVYKSDKPDTIARSPMPEDERPEWKKWLDWVKGK